MTFGVMFHHFHSQDDARPTPGSITSDVFDQLLTQLKSDYDILGASDYVSRALNGTLADRDICITFDDALRSQSDIAAPVLDAHKLTAFYFVYTGAFQDMPPVLEFARDFRSSFPSTEDYYDRFWAHMAVRDTDMDAVLQDRFPPDYLAKLEFYSLRDRQYRFFRDHVLMADYDEIVRDVMNTSGYDWDTRRSAIFMDETTLVDLSSQGHIIGLHSDTHPTMMHTLKTDIQAVEYETNFEHLTKLLDAPIETMSHPCGRYDDSTLEILRGLGVKVGFRSTPNPTEIRSLLEIPREDHSHLIQRYGLAKAA